MSRIVPAPPEGRLGQPRMRKASSGGQPRWTSSIAWWRSTSVRAASATASSPAKPTRMSSAVRQRSTRSSSVSTISCAAVFIRSLRSHTFGNRGRMDLPLRGDFAGLSAQIRLLNRGGAQEVPHGGEEVRLRVDAVLGAELQELRPERGDEIDVHGQLAGEVADDAGELANHAGRGAARVDLEPYLAPLRHSLERRHLERDQLRLALLLVVDAALDDEHGVLDEQPAGGRVGRVEDDDLDRAGQVLELDERHRLALLRRRRPQAGDDAAREDGLALAPPLELRERGVGAAPQLVADRAERMLGDVEAEALLLHPQ